MTGERLHELEHRTTEITQSENEKENRLKKEITKLQGPVDHKGKLTFVSLDPRRGEKT